MNSNKTVVEINRDSQNRINRAEYFLALEAELAKSDKENAKRLKNKKRMLESFAKVVKRAAQKNGITGSMKFDQLKSVIVFGQGDKTANINLSNLHREYHAALPGARQQVMVRYIDAVKDAMENLPQLFANFAAAKKHLMPLVRCRTINENEHMEKDYSSNWTPSIPFSSDASIVLGTDMKRTIGIVKSKTLERWGVSFDDAMEAAMENLRNRSAVTVVEIAHGVFRATWHDDYDASCILLPDVISNIGIVSDPIFMIPTKNCILMTAGNNVIGQRKMLEVAEKEMKLATRYVSTKFYRLQHNAVVEFVPDDETILDRLKAVTRIVIKKDYDHQQLLMLAREDNDIFVATYSFVIPTGTTDLLSYCAWTEDIQQSLPETDLIAMLMPAESQAEFDPFPKLVKWSDVVEILGNKMEKVDSYPVRYLVSGYPTAAQFEKLKTVVLKNNS